MRKTSSSNLKGPQKGTLRFGAHGSVDPNSGGVSTAAADMSDAKLDEDELPAGALEALNAFQEKK